MKKNILIVYYSLQGHTKEVSNIIKDITGGDIFEIELEKPYNLFTSYTIGVVHTRTGHTPSFKNHLSNLKDYDTIFIGSPIWCFTFAPPITSFLKEYNLENKTIVPFCTHGGNPGNFFEKIESMCPNSKVLKGIDFPNSKSKNPDDLKHLIGNWLHEINI